MCTCMTLIFIVCMRVCVCVRIEVDCQLQQMKNNYRIDFHKKCEWTFNWFCLAVLLRKMDGDIATLSEYSGFIHIRANL